MFSTVKRVHFIGIGGIGMSGIAEILINRGFEVSGSDMAVSENTEHLENLGAKVAIGHAPENIEGAEVVVYSSAVNPKENVETNEAYRKGIPVIRRAEMLAQVSLLNYCLAVAGTHGKTTTTSMIGLIMIKAGLDPTVIVGGRLRDLGGTNARLGKGEWTVVEADEYDRSFLQLSPAVAIINNIEEEHLDIYSDFNDLKQTFTEFGNKVPFFGFLAVGLDDPGVGDILSKLNTNIVSYGLMPHCDFQAVRPVFEQRSTTFTVMEHGEEAGELAVNIPGEHNMKNALAAVAVARTMGIDFDVIRKALAEFCGVFRRFDIKGEKDGILVVDDYAHHPTEVQATLSAARNGWDRRVVCVFQPHTFTRTEKLHKDFGRSFFDADVLVVTGIYPAREKPIEGVSGKLIADAAKRFGHKCVYYVEENENLSEELDKILKPGDIVLTVGAGNIWQAADKLIGEQNRQ